ncbi:permease [Anaerolineales bacterium]
MLALGLMLMLGIQQNNPGGVISVWITRFLGSLIEAFPFLLMGCFVSGIIDAFIRIEDIHKIVPKNPIFASIGGIFLGFLFPVCEYGVVLVVRRLYKKGLPVSVGVAFLLAAPVMNPIVLASTFIAFGFGPILIGRFLITAFIALSVSLIFNLTNPAETLLTLVEEDSDNTDPAARPAFKAGMHQALATAIQDFFEMGRYLVIGCMLAATMQSFVNQQVLFNSGQGSVISVLMMQVLAFVVSICSTTDAFLALTFANTFAPGAILAFLNFGSMVDIKSSLMFMGVFKKRSVFYLILLPFLMNLLIGSLINLLPGY